MCYLFALPVGLVFFNVHTTVLLEIRITIGPHSSLWVLRDTEFLYGQKPLVETHVHLCGGIPKIFRELMCLDGVLSTTIWILVINTLRSEMGLFQQFYRIYDGNELPSIRIRILADVVVKRIRM